MFMSSRRDFDIAFVGLKPGVHEYEYHINDSFFEDFQEQDFRNCNAHVKLYLEKNATGFMQLRFEIGGSVEVVCDRCSSNLPMQLFEEFTIAVKMVENPEVMNDQEEDPDVYYISRGESHLDVKGWIYEFINLSIPMQKTCEFENMDGPHCNTVAREVLNKLNNGESRQDNPMWKGLEKFKDLNRDE